MKCSLESAQWLSGIKHSSNFHIFSSQPSITLQYNALSGIKYTVKGLRFILKYCKKQTIYTFSHQYTFLEEQELYRAKSSSAYREEGPLQLWLRVTPEGMLSVENAQHTVLTTHQRALWYEEFLQYHFSIRQNTHSISFVLQALTNLTKDCSIIEASWHTHQPNQVSLTLTAHGSTKHIGYRLPLPRTEPRNSRKNKIYHASSTHPSKMPHHIKSLKIVAPRKNAREENITLKINF